MSLRPAAWPAVCLGAVLIASGCGSGSDPGGADPVASRPAVATARVDEPGGAVSDGGGTPCRVAQRPSGRDYAVSEVPADDPDGGLVLFDGAGSGNVQVAILAQAAPVTAAGDPAGACVMLADRRVWWRVRSKDGVAGWVDSAYLIPRG